jgi:hypothetical protein
MSVASKISSGVLGGATTKLARSMTRKALHDGRGRPRVPAAARQRNGVVAMLAWAAALGVFLAIADVLMEQRKTTAPGQ